MSKVRSNERFGPFVLLRRLESDSLGESWRAVEWSADSWGQTVVVHILTGGDQSAVRQSAERARPIVAALTGTTVARHQQIGISGDTPWLAHEYPGGRSLHSVVIKARATGSTTPNPVPLDQVLAIVEKLALSVESLENVRYQGGRVVYGSVLPQFVWLSEDGEVRAAGHQIGPGVVASLDHADVRKDYAAYFAPELRGGGAPSRSSDVWSLGAILYLLLTGESLPDPADAGAVSAALRNPQLLHRSEAVPADILSILRRSLESDPSVRFATATEMRADLERLLNGGSYTPTTFNLAFYLSGLLKKEMEAESVEREKEAALNPADFRNAPEPAAPIPAHVPAPAPVSSTASSPFSSHAEPRKKRSPAIAIALVALLLAGGAAAAWFMTRKPAADSPSQTASMTTSSPAPGQTPPPASTAPMVEPVLALGSEEVAGAPLDDAARQKAREDAINQRLQEEMLKLQAQYERELQQQTRQTQEAIAATREQNAPPPQPAPQKAPATRTAETAPPEATPEPAAPPVTKAAESETKVAAQAPPAVVPSAAAPQPRAVREGDLVAVSELDRSPEPTAPIRPSYPPIALRRRTEGSVILSVLINESGRVQDVRVLRGDPSELGFDDAAIRAVRQATFTPPMKDGVRVKTWKPMPVVFKP